MVSDLLARVNGALACVVLTETCDGEVNHIGEPEP